MKEDGVTIPPEPVYKRIMDYGVGSIALVIFSPVVVPALIASAIVHESNPVFKQERIGKGGKPFTIYKIKTMRDAFDSASGVELSKDARTTRLGLLLRKTKIDELPQLVNVVKGEMSLVGPRPYISENEAAHDKLRQSVKPGMTGLQQITGGNALTYEERLKLDHQYIKRRNLFFDVAMCIGTLGAIFRQRNEPHFNDDIDTPKDDNRPEP